MMFLKQTRRLGRGGKAVTYLSLVESVWDPRKQASVHEAVFKFGRDCAEVRESLLRLMQSLGRFLYLEAVLPNEALSVRGIFGAGYLLRNLWHSLGLEHLVEAKLESRGIDPCAGPVLFNWLAWLVLSYHGSGAAIEAFDGNAPVGMPEPFPEDLEAMADLLRRDGNALAAECFAAIRDRGGSHDELCVLSAFPVRLQAQIPLRQEQPERLDPDGGPLDGWLCFFSDVKGRIHLCRAATGEVPLEEILAAMLASFPRSREETLVFAGHRSCFSTRLQSFVRNAGFKSVFFSVLADEPEIAQALLKDGAVAVVQDSTYPEVSFCRSKEKDYFVVSVDSLASAQQDLEERRNTLLQEARFAARHAGSGRDGEDPPCIGAQQRPDARSETGPASLSRGRVLVDADGLDERQIRSWFPQAFGIWMELSRLTRAAIHELPGLPGDRTVSPFTLQGLAALLTFVSFLDAEVREKAGETVWSAVEVMRSMRLLRNRSTERPDLLSAPEKRQKSLLRALGIPVPGTSSRGRPVSF